jgi:putative transposase
MFLYPRYFEPGQPQFLTTSTYRRNPLFACDRFRWYFVEVLRELRPEPGFLLIGWVLMPERFHLLFRPGPAEQTSAFMQALKKRTAQRIIASLSGQSAHPGCRRVLAGLRLPPTVHRDSRYRVWQRRFFPFNVYAEKKRLQKLDYMHQNPVRQGS